MESSWSDAFLASKRNFWILSALTILLFATANLPWELDEYDQAKQAFTSFEMIQEGHWLYQRTPDDAIATKPPLIGWISAACFSVTRSWEISWRLPSFAAAVIMLALLARVSGAAYGAPAALIAMSAFGLNLLSPRLATLVRTDMPLAFVIFLIGLQIWQKIRKRQAWRARDRLVQFALLTAAMLIKGPIVCAFLLPGIAFFQWRMRRKNGEAHAWCGWWPWIASLSIFLVWVAGGIIWIPDFYEHVVVREFAGRFGQTIHRSQSIFFYLLHLLHKFAPWSLLMAVLAILDFRAAKLDRFKQSSFWTRMSPETVWLICWSLGGLLMMSLVPSKRVDRIFPVLPPLCLLLAAQCSQLRSEESSARLRRCFVFAIIFACVFSGGYVTARVMNGYRTDRASLVEFGKQMRQEAAVRNWRYEIVAGRGGGILLYLHRTHFIEPERAIAEWNAGKIDVLIGPEDDAPKLMQRLKGISRAHLQSVERRESNLQYFVLKRN